MGLQISEIKQWFLALLLCASWFGSAQETKVQGLVLSADSLRPIPDTHVINVRTEKGTLTNARGAFEIEANPGDTLVFSNIAFSYLYWRVPENGGKHQILLKSRNYLLDEVSIFTYQLTTNEPKEMVLNAPLYPEVGDYPYPTNRPAPTASQPLDALYEAFGSKPNQIRKLQEQLAKASFRDKLKSGNNRRALMELTGLKKEELEQFLFYCQYSPYFIQTSSDYAFLISLLRCFEEYERTKEVENILREND